MFSTQNALILALLVVGLCYANSLPNEFILDDISIVSANPAIRSISPIRFFSSPYWAKEQDFGIYRPVTILSFSTDYALWQNWAPGFRLTNLVLHALNGWLVFLLSLNLVGRASAAIAAMVLYLAHPVHTEAVAGIVGRGELLAGCFFLAAWLLFRRGQTGWAATLYFLSLLSKENAIVLPMVLALDIWLSEGSDSKKVLAAWRRLAVVTAAAAAYLVLRFSVLGVVGIPASARYLGGSLSLPERWMTSGRVFLEYFRLLLLPVDVAGDYDFNAIPVARFLDWDAWLGILLVLATVFSAYVYRHRNWIISLGLLFLIIALLPASNWIMPISVLMAERFLYLPLFGLALTGGIAFSEIRRQRIQRLVGAGFFIVAALLCASHNYTWRNPLTFYGNMVRAVPNNAKARLGYGFALLEAGRKADAEREIEAGLRILPDSPALLSTLALARMTENDCSQAFPWLHRALDINPKHGDTLRRLADCLYREGDKQQAEWMYRRALENIPFPDALMLLMWARSLEDTGQLASAIAAYKRAALIDPNNVFIKQKLFSLGAGAERRYKEP